MESTPSCGSCAVQTDATLRCARRHTLYCSRPCQVAHWAGGHKKDCKGLARARRDTDLEAQSRALARVSHMSGGAPNDAHYLTCLDGGDVADPLMRGCACRGSSGWTHATCLVKMAEAARAPPRGQPIFDAWVSCATCKQRFTGQVRLRLAIALWAKHARAVETDKKRLAAASTYAMALGGAGEHAKAARLQRGILDVYTHVSGPEHPATLTSTSNLAGSLFSLGECAEAAVLLRTTLAARTRALGADDVDTLVTEGQLVLALLNLGECAGAEALGRGTLEKLRRILGPDHCYTIISSGNLAAALLKQGKHAEAVEIEREVLVLKTRLLGAEHEETLVSATNLARSLCQCGLKTEAEQIIRGTLVICQRAFGPTHELTHTCGAAHGHGASWTACARLRSAMSDLGGYCRWLRASSQRGRQV